MNQKNQNQNNNRDLVAIDIGKDSLQVQTTEAGFSASNNDKGFAELLKRLARLASPFVICEATGGYERALMTALHQAHIAVHLVNPARVRAFCRSEGIKAKTDPIDARMLLRFAQEKKPHATPPPEPTRQELADLLDRRSHLTEQLAREKNRLQKSPPCTAKSIQRSIRFFEKEITAIDKKIRKLIDSDDQIKGQAMIFQSVKGVGEITSWTILAYLGEIGHVSRNQLVALAGVAPYNRDSGKKSGRRCIQAGRAKVRRCLYMAAQVAARFNPVIKEYVGKLIARGKPYKCAMVAAMRKLLIHMQSLLKNHQIALAK